jgi:hypothetical protein
LPVEIPLDANVVAVGHLQACAESDAAQLTLKDVRLTYNPWTGTKPLSIKPKYLKPKLIKHASAGRFDTRIITFQSSAVIEVRKIEPPLGLNQGQQQHLISATFGGPGQARDVVGSP